MLPVRIVDDEPSDWRDTSHQADYLLITHPDFGSAAQALANHRSGLGLTVARELARLMGGDLEYHRRDRWNVFALSLPAAPVSRLAQAG